MMEDNVYLGFITLVGSENKNDYIYEFIFTNNIDDFFGDNFEYKPACMINDLMPYEEYIYEVHIVKTKIKFDLVQDNCCFGMQDCMDGCIAVAYFLDEDSIENSMTFMFGETIDEVEKKLALHNILLE